MSALASARRPSPTAILALVGRRLIDAVSITILLVALALLVPGMFDIQRYVITGGSMSGSFEAGAVVFTQKVAIQDLRFGDVITYLPPPDIGVNSLVTHRIAAIEDDPEQGLLFTTKGDANEADDPWQFHIDSPTQPKVILAVDHLGWPMVWLSDPTSRKILIGIPAAIIFVLAAREFSSTLRRQRPSTAAERADLTQRRSREASRE